MSNSSNYSSIEKGLKCVNLREFANSTAAQVLAQCDLQAFTNHSSIHEILSDVISGSIQYGIEVERSGRVRQKGFKR